MLHAMDAPTAFSVSINPVPVYPVCLVSITPELPQNPTALSSNNQLLSAATDDATDEELLLELLTTLLLTLELLTCALLTLALLLDCTLDVDEAAAPHKLPVTTADPAVPFA